MGVLLGLFPSVVAEAVNSLCESSTAKEIGTWVWCGSAALTVGVSVLLARVRGRRPNAGAAGVAVLAFAGGWWAIFPFEVMAGAVAEFGVKLFPAVFGGFLGEVSLYVGLIALQIGVALVLLWRWMTGEWFRWTMLSAASGVGFVLADKLHAPDWLISHPFIWLAMPGWFVGVACWALSDPRRIEGVCPNCGYDLAGLGDEICPECGTRV